MGSGMQGRAERASGYSRILPAEEPGVRSLGPRAHGGTWGLNPPPPGPLPPPPPLIAHPTSRAEAGLTPHTPSTRLQLCVKWVPIPTTSTARETRGVREPVGYKCAFPLASESHFQEFILRE